MTRKEKKAFLNDIKEAQNYLKQLKKDIEKNQSKLDSITEEYNQKVEEAEELDKQIQQGKMYMDLESAIEKLEMKVINYYDIKDLVFAEYKVKEDDPFNLGVFLISLSDYGMTPDGSEERCYLYKNIFVPQLIAGLDRKKHCMTTVSGLEMSIKEIQNIVAFSDVLLYTNKKELLTRSKIAGEEIIDVMQFVIENAEVFGYSGYEDKAKLLQKSRQS